MSVSEVANRTTADSALYGTAARKAYVSLKHSLDFVVAVIALIILSPILLLVAILIRLDSPGPVIYRQTRVGRFGRPFRIYKFRTMKIGAPVLSTAEMQRQEQIPFTRLGPLLRKSNIDELPQLFNIIKGEMSFIGPRPALPTQEDVNTTRERCGVDSLRPGLTGLAQATGRDELDTVTKVERDAEYLRKISLWFDLRVLILTVGAVITGAGSK